MHHNLSRDNKFYAMDKNNAPAIYVDSGDTVTLEAHDCFTGQITVEENTSSGLKWDEINPATGPVYVNGLKPGNALKVTIEKIDIGDQGIVVTGPQSGVMGDELTEFTRRILPIDKENNTVDFDGFKIPVNKMIGVIGVAPEGNAVNNGTPGDHGGNMDSIKITEGATLYLPAFHEGGLFGLGDVHGAMGDGEVGVSGLEVESEVTVKLEVVEDIDIAHPLLVNDEGAFMNVSDEDLNIAVDQSVKEMIKFLQPYTKKTLNEMAKLMSLTGHTQVNQVVDPKKTGRYFVPKFVLDHFEVPLYK